MPINCIIADATQPTGAGPKIIVHVCNDVGGWGSVHMPRIVCGLAGGKWEEVGKIVVDEFAKSGVLVTVYDLPS